MPKDSTLNQKAEWSQARNHTAKVLRDWYYFLSLAKEGFLLVCANNPTASMGSSSIWGPVGSRKETCPLQIGLNKPSCIFTYPQWGCSSQHHTQELETGLNPKISVSDKRRTSSEPQKDSLLPGSSPCQYKNQEVLSCCGLQG